MTNQIGQKQNDIALLAQQLELLNPLHLLVKGYTKIEYKGQPIQSSHDVTVGDSIDITMQDGTLKAMIEEIHTNG